ncbi:MAG TPA: FliM/FliN family flagellar motor C-terminal domain-containing protein [Terracidiphilus sp.]|jgi:hypothetical protein|nr:FliM/FliN family flagellar motor C-terminal domain-containing protein [Terracidiphilus sp.]
MPGRATDPIRGTVPPAVEPGGTSGKEALVPSLPRFGPASVGFDGNISRLPIELDVAIPVKSFRVRNLLALEPGQVVETQWADGADMPLAASQVQLAWSEFEVVDKRLAVRLTRLA